MLNEGKFNIKSPRQVSLSLKWLVCCLRDSTLESLTPNVNAPSAHKQLVVWVPNSPFDGSKIWVIKRACMQGCFWSCGCMSLQFGFVGWKYWSWLEYFEHRNLFFHAIFVVMVVHVCSSYNLGTQDDGVSTHSTSLALQNLKIWNSLLNGQVCILYRESNLATFMFCTILVLNSLEAKVPYFFTFLGRGEQFHFHM
jgi:hypothetical protein